MLTLLRQGVDEEDRKYLRYLWREGRLLAALLHALNFLRAEWRYHRLKPLRLEKPRPIAGGARILPSARLDSPRSGAFQIALPGLTLCTPREIDFDMSFTDQERTFALHRFGWLVRLLVEDGRPELPQRAHHWMRAWLDRQPRTAPRTAPWHSYTVSERIVNWTTMNWACGESDISRDPLIQESLHDQLLYLSRHLEIRNHLTGNHILNNARALYFGGVAYASPAFKTAGKDLFREWTDRLISPRGFLRENSSHYHWLLLRTFLEVFRLASLTSDSDLAAWMRGQVERMAHAAEFLAIQDADGHVSIPFFGNISPDFPFKWIQGTLIAAREWTGFRSSWDLGTVPRGWHTLWV